MALAASNPMSLILARAKKTLGQCTAWQSWTGHDDDETSATAHIAEYQKEWEESEVDAGRDVRAMIALAGARPFLNTSFWSAEVVFHFEAPVDPLYTGDPEQAFREFNNNLAGVLAEMVADAAADTAGLLLNIQPGSLQFLATPQRVPEDARDTDGDVIWAEVQLACGPRGG